jgi:hypothetical protein
LYSDIALVLADQSGELGAPSGQGSHWRSRRPASRPRKIRSGG